MTFEPAQHHRMNHGLSRLLPILLLLAFPAYAGDKKGQNIAVSFHMETDANNNPKNIYTQTVAGKVRYFQKAPDITSKDIGDGFGRDSGKGKSQEIIFPAD